MGDFKKNIIVYCKKIVEISKSLGNRNLPKKN